MAFFDAGMACYTAPNLKGLFVVLERDEMLAHQEAPFLELLHEALHNKTTTFNGTMRGEEYTPMITEELSSDSAFYQLETQEQEQVLGAVVRATYTLNKRQEAQSPFWENDARVRLTDEIARESLRFKAEGWAGKRAVHLALFQSFNDMVALRDEYLTEHGPLLTVGRILKFIDGSRANPRETLELIVAAFKHTRQNERILHASDTDLFDSVSIPALKKGDLTITPKKAALPELPLDDVVTGMEYIYATATSGRENSIRKAGNASLVSYLDRVVEDARQTSSQIEQLTRKEYADFLQLVGWYADSSGYEAINTPEYVQALTERYAHNVVALESFGMSRNDALRHATYHDATYYENVVKEALEYGLPKDNLVAVFIKRHPIDCGEKLQELKPVYDKLCQELPDLQPGNRLMMAIRCMKHDITQEVANYNEAVRNATLIFTGRASAKVIQTICVVAPNHYMERLAAYAAAHPLANPNEPADINLGDNNL